MKRIQIRVSEQTHEDLLRIADGVPIQRYLERMIDEAIIRATDPPLPASQKRPARDVSSPEPILLGEMCSMCVKAGPPKTRPCSKCGYGGAS